MPAGTDWEKIEVEYRAGQLSLREIARQHGITDTAIRKRAKADGWQRDLADKVRKRAAELLVRVDAGSQSGSQSAREAEVQTEAAALTRVEVVRSHRGAIGRGRDLTLRLLDELDATTSHLGELEMLIEADTAGEKNPQRRNGMHRAVSLPSRAGVIKDLSAAAKNWVMLERQAFGLDDGAMSNEPATRGDVQSALAKLDRGQRDQLRGIAAALAGGPEDSSEGT